MLFLESLDEHQWHQLVEVLQCRVWHAFMPHDGPEGSLRITKRLQALLQGLSFSVCAKFGKKSP